MSAFHSLLSESSFLLALEASDRPSALRQLAAWSSKACSCGSEVLFDALLAREALGSTGLSLGTAVAHARIGGLVGSFVGFARLATPLDWEAGRDTETDEEPLEAVDLLGLVLVPERAPEETLEILAEVAHTLRQADFAAALRAARTPGQAFAQFTALSRAN